ncbi:P-loop containing nucleoside triphosphate hydrolase protein [Fusarium oxysporum f. sp. albedinis]|nr:P-loop containing nucleoside triphosphate hydrolase protein [Fusarium oxysporum f. sp. albedinis]
MASCCSLFAKGTSSNINAIITRMQALSTKTQTLDRGSKTGPHLFTDFMENTDEEEEGDGDVEGFDEDNIVAYLNTLHGCIIAKHVAPHIGYIPGIKPGNILFEHRRQAVGAAMQSPAGPFKVMILGGPLGLGKTLVALAVAALSWKPGDVSSFIVAPLSCCNQCGWLRLMLFLMERIRFPFRPAEIPGRDYILFISCCGGEPCRKVPVCHQRLQCGAGDPRPRETELFLRSGSLGSEPWKPIGKCMILDEAHVIKNRNTRTFAAVTALREQFEGCLTLTGTPLDDTWEDGYALLSLLKGHPITSFKIFQKIFKES